MPPSAWTNPSRYFRLFAILGVPLVETGHRFLVGDVAGGFVPLAVELLDRFHVETLALRRGLFDPFLSCGAQAAEDAAGGGDVLLRPQRMVVAHRFAPVGESETGVDLLGVLERLRSFLVPEVMERPHSSEKRILGF